MQVRPSVISGVAGLVVLAGIDGQLADELAGGGVDDAYVEVLDEQDARVRA
jgi:hypothetical protein